MNFSLGKSISFAYGSITRRLYVHTTIIAFFLLIVISITIWAGNTLTMITAIARFERTHTVSRVEAMVALLEFFEYEKPGDLERFQAKMAITQSYNKVFSRLLDMRKDTPNSEFVRVLENTFSETDHKMAVIIVNRMRVLYWHPILKELVANAGEANAAGEIIKIQAAQFLAANNGVERAAIFAEIEKTEEEFIFYETNFSKLCSDLSDQISSYVNYITIFLIIISVGFTGLLAYVIAKTVLKQTETYTSELEKEIQERTRVEDNLRETNAYLDNLFNYANAPIMVWDTSYRITRFNKAFETLTGLTANEVIGSNISILFPPDQIDDSMALIKSSLDGERMETVEIQILHVNGAISTVLWNSATILENNGTTPIATIAQGHDITERRRAREEKANLEAQLQQAQKLESVGHLAGGVAHDFNNMLSVIIGHSELALMKLEPSQPIYANLNEIRSAAERSADLTRQLLAFARKQTIAPRVVKLNDIVSGMLNMLQRLIGEDRQLTWQPAADLWPVKVDPSQIDQMLANLCVNARDAITNIGKITIETGNGIIDANYCMTHAYVEPGEYVRIAVSDDGRGMDKETQSHIFEPFFTTKGLGKGSGLGLSTVYGIVKQNNGFINVYSEPGHGTTFTIYLPRHFGDMEETLKGASTVTIPRGNETILLVEDEPSILKMATILLEGQGYTVLTAGTAGEAIRIFKEQAGTIRMLMTDVVMPDMNGRSLLNELLPLNPYLECLFMSGYTANVIAHHGVLDEGVHFIQKPFSLSDLATKVRDVLDNPQ